MLTFGQKPYARELLKNQFKQIKVIASIPSNINSKQTKRIIAKQIPKRRALSFIDVYYDGFQEEVEEYNYENDRREKILSYTMDALTKQLYKYPHDINIRETFNKFCSQNKKWLDEQARKNISLYDDDYY
jgi:hypothetical protein